MKSNVKKLLCAAMAVVMTVSLTACGGQTDRQTKKSPLDPKNPTTITIWNYYNDDQLSAFDELVSEFNSTVGIEEGIAVVSESLGSIDNVADNLLQSADGKVGAKDMPNLSAAYSETAYILNEKDLLVNLDDYFTEDELNEYVPGFIEEGRMTEDGELLELPTLKSTECFAINTTDWDKFKDATGITEDSIKTYEDITAAAQKYYEWTDGLTPDVAEDGKALYGRDSVANYIFIGTTQLGHEMFTVSSDGSVSTDMDRDTFKALWDNYYIPFINGYFASDAKYHSEDMKTGTIISMTGSTSGMSYLPSSVTDADDVSHDIAISVNKPLNFEDAKEPVAVQQGAGYCVFKGTEQQQYASVEFLKWFTDPERNLKFSILSGYSPVTQKANDQQSIKDSVDAADGNARDNAILSALLVSSDVYLNERTYTCKPFDGSKELRDVLADALDNTAKNDRAAVVQAIASGQSRAQATAQYSTDEYFDTWFENLCTSVEAVTVQ